MILIIVLDNVERDGRRLKDDLIITLMVNNDGNPSIGIHLKEPWLLSQGLQGKGEQHK